MSTLEMVTTRDTRLTSLSPTAMRGTVRNGAPPCPGWASARLVSVDVAGDETDREPARPLAQLELDAPW